MKLRRYFFILLILIVCMFSISAVCAADDAPVNAAIADTDDAIIDSIGEEQLDESDSNLLEVSEDTQVKETTVTMNFTALNNEIKAVGEGGTLNLTCDYAYDPDTDKAFEDGIRITQKVTIDGKNHTISGSKQARIFQIGESASPVEGVTIMNIKFINATITGTDVYGGAIRWYGDNGTLTGNTFTNNTATGTNIGNGGAIYWTGANGTLTGNTFTNNTATGTDDCWGGAICWYGANGTLTGNTFTNNTATGTNYDYGGAIYWSGVNGTLTGNTFTNNTATGTNYGYGGAINWYGANGNLTGNTFTNNTATGEYGGYGGAICWYGANGKLSGNTFTNNTAPGTNNGYGGAIDWTGDNGNLTGNTFTNNTATGTDDCWGGAIRWYGDNGNLTGNTFTNNTATGTNSYGGAIRWYGVNGKLTGNTFTDNTATGTNSYGGAVNWYSGVNGNLTGNMFIGNKAGQGGAYYNDYPMESNSQLSNNIFLDNGGNDIEFRVTGGSNTDYNWFGNDAGNYNTTHPNSPEETCTVWLFLNGTADPNEIELYSTSNIKFKLYAYNSTVPVKVFDYSNALLPVINLTISGEKGSIAKNAGLEETLVYNATEAGEGSVTASFEDVSWTIGLTNKKISTSISAGDVSATYNINKDLVITLKDIKGNPISGATVTVDIDGAVNYTSDENGEINVSTNGIIPGNYTAKISFAGDEIHAESSTTAAVEIKKATPSVTANAKTFKYEDKTKKYTITLKDNNGKALKNTKVTLKVNGKTYTATTNNNGVATFKLTKLTNKGTYNAVITYAGDKCYNKVIKKAKITVKAPAWKTVARGSKDKAMVKKIQKALKANGYYLSYKGRYLKVDGIFEKYTEMAVKQFQKDKGLKVTGKVDYTTAKKLKII